MQHRPLRRLRRGRREDGERRAQLAELADAIGSRARRHRHAPVEPLAGPADHRHAALPAEQRAPPLRRLAQQHASGSTCTSASSGADRAIAVCNALRNFLPELLALSASSPFVEDVDTRPALGAHADLHAHVPALRDPGRLRRLAGLRGLRRFLYGTGSIDEHTQLWWSVRPHLAYPTVEIRICDAQPDLAERTASPRSLYALAARIARALDEGEPLPDLPHRLIEENMWRAIRYGLSGELIDFDRGEPVPARARIEPLIEWVAPVADEIGAAPFLAVPAANAAERQYARLARRAARSSRSTPSRCAAAGARGG